MKKVLIASAAVLLAAVALVFVTLGHSIAYSQNRQGEPSREGSPRAQIAHVVQELGLSDDQRAQIKAIIADERSKGAVQSLISSLKSDDNAIREAVVSGVSADPAAANLSKAINSLVLEGLSVKAKVFSILTPEQEAKANTMIADFATHLGPGAFRGGGEFGARHAGIEGPGLLGMAQQLALTDDQKVKIQTIIASEHSSPEAQALIASLKSDRDALVSAVVQNQDASTAAANLSKDLSAMAITRARISVAIHGVLTPEQQDKLKALRSGGQKMGGANPSGDF
jgi:Spy/CpxP family protein refolding chaperone